MRNSRIGLLAAFALAALWARGANAAPIVVNGDADIFLAGQSSVPAFGGGAGELPPSFAVTPGEILNISATGLISCCSGSSPNGPDGNGGSSSISGYGNVGPYSGPDTPLVGVFDVGSPWSIFLIGSSLPGVVVPAGATELYLGIPDSFGFNGSPGYYGDNTGSFSVTIAAATTAVPEPLTLSIFGAGLAGVAVLRRGRKKKTA